MSKTIGYLRVSTNNQSNDSQKLLLLEYANRNGLTVDSWIEIKVSSRKRTDERLIDELIGRLQDGDVVLVAELSRLGRNMMEILDIIRRIDAAGALLVFVRQPELSTDSQARDLLLAVYGYIAQTERELARERINDGLTAAKARGVKLGRPKGSTGSKLDSRHDEIIEWMKMGLRQTAIAERVGCTPSHLSRWLKARKLR